MDHAQGVGVVDRVAHVEEAAEQLAKGEVAGLGRCLGGTLSLVGGLVPSPPRELREAHLSWRHRSVSEGIAPEASLTLRVSINGRRWQPVCNSCVNRFDDVASERQPAAHLIRKLAAKNRARSDF